MEIFCELWKKYDPKGTGYIKRGDIETLFTDLCDEEDCSFFKDDPEQVQNEIMLENLLYFLEIPMHHNLKSYLFYDVLSIICRFQCEMSHPIMKSRKEELKQ